MLKDQQLAEALSLWFSRHSKDPNRWRNPVGLVLKEGVSAFGNWRNAPRGNPKAGYRAMRERLEAGS